MMMFTARALVSIVLWATARASDVDPHAMLRTASAEGNVDNVQHWLQQGGDVNGMSPSGWTPLIYAADRSQVNIIDILLQANANPNIPERDGWTPLMFSAVKGDLESCSLLIRGGADLEHVSKNDWTPLKAAQRSKNPEAASFMENEIAKSKEIKVDNVGLGRDFLQAVKDSDLGTARGMLDRGIDPNTLSPNGWTAVTYAAANGNVEMMKLLISHGTDINKADKDGWTPIMFAAFQVMILFTHQYTVV